LGALALGLLAIAPADTWAWHGRGARAPRVSAARAYKPPRMPRAATPARSSMTRAGTHANNAYSHTGSGHNRSTPVQTHTKSTLAAAPAATLKPGTTGKVNPGTIGRVNAGTVNTAIATRPRTLNPAAAGIAGASAAGVAGFYPNTYTYGQGRGARFYRAYGYGAGYRNRYYGGRYGYGRSQGNNRAIVWRLRSVEANLARIDHDYQGHRVRAMHAIAMAIRQLSHRSMVYSGVGFAPRMTSGRAMGTGMGMGRGGLGAGAGVGGRRRGPMSQARSDARMGHALRTLEGINMQLGSQASFTTGHARARGHVLRAIQEVSTALSIR
jgi:hypothetical protein